MGEVVEGSRYRTRQFTRRGGSHLFLAPARGVNLTKLVPFLELVLSSSIASRTRSPGTDFEMACAEVVSQFMMSFAP